MSRREYGPETRGIIEAINGLKKPAHEHTTYRVVQLDLGVARANELYPLEGWFDFLGVGKLTGTCSVRINEATKDLIDLAYVKTMTLPIRNLYFTNDAQPGCELTLGLGGEASFVAEPIRQGRQNFSYCMLDEDGALNSFEDNQAHAVLPTHMLITWFIPADLKEGIVQMLKVRLNPTAAVTYRLRLWTAALNGAVAPYNQEMALIYEMDFDAADDVLYVILMNRPIMLLNPGQIWYSITWSGAPGNTPGIITLEGERIR